MNELSIIKACQSGDKAAFSPLIDKYYKGIYRFAYQYTGNHHNADEVCQETFLRAISSIRKLRKSSSFQNWIFTIALNLLRKRAKKNKREKRLMTQI